MREWLVKNELMNMWKEAVVVLVLAWVFTSNVLHPFNNR
jgi:hypothetical protein